MPKGLKAKKAKAIKKGGREAKKALKGRREKSACSEGTNDELCNTAHQADWEDIIGRSIENDEEDVATPNYSNNNDDQLAENIQKALAFIMAQK